MTSSNKHLDLLKDSIPSLIHKTSIPAILGMFFGTLYNIIDTIYAGQYSTDALAALTISFPIYFLFLLSIAVGFSNGLKTVIAHALGRKDNLTAGCLLVQGIPLAILSGLIVNICAYASLDYLIATLSNKDTANSLSISYAKEYLSVIFLGGISFNILYALIAPLGAIGDTKTMRNGELSAAIVNIGLNPILMFGWFGLPALGVAGLAVSTITIWCGVALYAAYKLRTSTLWAMINFQHLTPKPELWGKILAQSIPSVINMIRIGIIFWIFAFVMNKFGTNVLAGYGAGFRVEGLIILPVIGLNIAIVAIVAQNFGAKNYSRVRKVYRLTLKYGLIMMFVGSILVYLCAPILIIPFTNDPQTRLYAIEYLRIDAFALPSIAIVNLAGAMMQGMQRTMLSVSILIVTQAILPAIALPIVAQYYDHTVVWWTMAGMLWISAFAMLIMVHFVLKEITITKNRISSN